MARRLIFTAKTPLGDLVRLTRDRWRQIIRYKHPALAGHVKTVRTCLESPTMVRTSAKDPDTHLYYLVVGNAHLCVVTGLDGNRQRFVITAYFTKNVKEGSELWRK